MTANTPDGGIREEDSEHAGSSVKAACIRESANLTGKRETKNLWKEFLKKSRVDRRNRVGRNRQGNQGRERKQAAPGKSH